MFRSYLQVGTLIIQVPAFFCVLAGSDSQKNALGSCPHFMDMGQLAAMGFNLDFKVRDYECDLQGIVNNAVYQQYLEHARHEFLLSQGLSFAKLTERGVFIVVAKIEINYRRSLCSGDEFTVSVAISRPSKVRIVFDQEIYRGDEKILDATVTTTAVNERNRPYFPEEFADLLTATKE